MSKSIYERANVTASVILNRKGEHVATVRHLYGSGGTVYCEVLNFGDAVTRCLDTAERIGHVSAATLAKIKPDPRYYATADAIRRYQAHELFSMQRGRAGGYGYDKATAALAGMLIDGHSLANHCGSVPEDEKRRARLFREYCNDHDSADRMPRGRDYWEARAKRIGCRFANWCDAGRTDRGNDAPPVRGRYTSLYFQSGLDRLSDLGYNVVSAV